MGENPYLSYAHQVRLFYHEMTYVSLLSMIQVQISVGDLHRGHLRSTEVTNMFLLIAHDSKELRHGRGCIVLVLSQRIV